MELDEEELDNIESKLSELRVVEKKHKSHVNEILDMLIGEGDMSRKEMSHKMRLEE
jgi:DNA repair ATPase RecN